MKKGEWKFVSFSESVCHITRKFILFAFSLYLPQKCFSRLCKYESRINCSFSFDLLSHLSIGTEWIFFIILGYCQAEISQTACRLSSCYVWRMIDMNQTWNKSAFVRRNNSPLVKHLRLSIRVMIYTQLLIKIMLSSLCERNNSICKSSSSFIVIISEILFIWLKSCMDNKMVIKWTVFFMKWIHKRCCLWIYFHTESKNICVLSSILFVSKLICWNSFTISTCDEITFCNVMLFSRMKVLLTVVVYWGETCTNFYENLGILYSLIHANLYSPRSKD